MIAYKNIKENSSSELAMENCSFNCKAYIVFNKNSTINNFTFINNKELEILQETTDISKTSVLIVKWI